MSEELLVNVTPQETRVALVENGGLQELHTERQPAPAAAWHCAANPCVTVPVGEYLMRGAA